MSEKVPLQVAVQRESWFGSFWSWFRSWVHWRPTSVALLREAEKSLLINLKNKYHGKNVNVGNVVGCSESNVWTVCMNEESPNTPMVLLHGFGSGLGLWCLNLDSLATNRPVYAIDIIGFGQSSRPKFSKDPLEVEHEFVASIEAWRIEMGLNKFILVGHAFGGFLAAAYSINHPDRTSHLILANPWGFPEQPLDVAERKSLPFWVKAGGALLQLINPLFVVRSAGPLGPKILSIGRPDLMKKFSPLIEAAEEVIPNYLYHCNAKDTTGETAFHNLMSEFGWAKYPLINRIDVLRKGVPITLIYGSRTWVDREPGFQIKYNLKDSFVDIKVISGAGHHVYADRAETFNKLINSIGEHVDSGKLPPISPEETQENHKGKDIKNK